MTVSPDALRRTAGTEHTRQPYLRTVSELAAELDTDATTGLGRDEAARRLARLGPNLLRGESDGGALRRMLRQFHDPLVYVLLAAAVVTLVLGEFVDSGVIMGVVLLNAVIGYVQEARAREALDALARLAAAEATVVRDGAVHRIPAEQLVPGDLLIVQAGDKVAADVRITEARNLEIDESAVTGESMPVAKTSAALSAEVALGDRINLGFSGTIVTRGSGRAVVVATGAATELGLISSLVRSAGSVSTPLTRQLGVFSRRLAVVIVGLAIVTLVIGLVRGSPFGEMFTAAVALAVGAIPEGLPAAVTIVLAIGVTRMARRRAIIRRLPAVETLGGTTVICTDKTGTLTANEMTVTTIRAGGRTYAVSGTGYAPIGEIDGDVGSDPALRECLLAGLLCNEAALRETADGWEVVGDPTEGALIVVARKAGTLLADPVDYPRVHVLPFESERRYMATLHQEAGGRVGYVKGAVERVLALCTHRLDADGVARPADLAQEWAAAEEMAARGLRVLAFARLDPPADTEEIREEDLHAGLTLLGLQAMHDPPREEAITAVAACRAAGIDVKMITGDHGATAAAIGRHFGLRPAVVNGGDIASTPDDELAGTDIFARVSPEQKLRLVELLQRRGHVVAMTGDGVNDAPALRQAEIGVAMGRAGTEAAKEAADMVLSDDNFATIEAAVEEGRGVFDNLRKFLAWTLPTNIGEGLVILVSIVLGTALPILPVQILWINMTTAVLLGLTLAFEPKEPGIMGRAPRTPGQSLLTGDLVRRILLVSAVLLAGSFALFQWQLASGASVEVARTAAINVFVVVEMMYLVSCRSLRGVVPNAPNPWLLGGLGLMALLQVLITYTPLMNVLFHTAPLPLSVWLVILGVGAIAYVVVELDKAVWRWAGARRDGNDPGGPASSVAGVLHCLGRSRSTRVG